MSQSNWPHSSNAAVLSDGERLSGVSQTSEDSGSEGRHRCDHADLEHRCMLDLCVNTQFPVSDHCTVLIQVAFVDDVSNWVIVNYGRFRNLSPLESSIEEGGKEKMQLFLVSCINTNWHNELWCPLVVRVLFILGTDLTEPKTYSVAPQIFLKACYVSVMALSVADA